MNLSKKTILITGATDGIGKALAIEFSKLGANIILLGRDSSKLDTVYDQLEHSYESQKHLILEVDLALLNNDCLLYTSPSPRDGLLSRMPSSA